MKSWNRPRDGKSAARIESNTIGGQVLIGESTHDLIKDLVEADSPRTVMMKGLKRPLVIYQVTAIRGAYDIQIKTPDESQSGVNISLPFHCWKVEDKKIASESVNGETLTLNENLISATIDPPFEPLTDIRLIFDFCTNAHCFEEIYAKVLSVEDKDGQRIHVLSITAIDQEDREILNKWTEESR